MSGDYHPTPQEYAQVMHHFVHLMWRRGLAPWARGRNVETMMVADECWFGEDIPDWIERRIQKGQPGERWCPILNPTLLEEVSVPQ